jgi:hypothetical protein
MLRKCSVLILVIYGTMSIMMFLPSAIVAGPKGAKAIFDSGEGPSISMSVDQIQRPSSAAAEPLQQEKYIGVSYQLLLLSDDGQFQAVPQTRVFRPGERMRLLVRTNRPGYMTIFNVGPTGNTNLLFNEYVEPSSFLQIPKNTNLRFVGAPGTEKIFIMLSDQPNPIFNQTAMTATGPVPPPSSPAVLPSGFPSSSFAPTSGTGGFLPPPPPTSDVSALPPPPPVTSMLAGIEGAKSLQGAKDIVAEDNMKTNYAVISPRNNYRPVNMGMKDIVLESSTGNNYGVVPASTLAGGGILTMEIKLEHR